MKSHDTPRERGCGIVPLSGPARRKIPDALFFRPREQLVLRLKSPAAVRPVAVKGQVQFQTVWQQLHGTCELLGPGAEGPEHGGGVRAQGHGIRACSGRQRPVGMRAVSSSTPWLQGRCPVQDPGDQGVGTRRWSSSNQFWTKMISGGASVPVVAAAAGWIITNRPSGATS